MTTLSQRSFAGGELAPALYARVDTVRYTTGCRTLRNMLVMRHGGATSRAGSELVAEIKDSSKTVVTIPFIFNADQTYVLEFGDLYMRVHRNGEQVRESAKVISAATKANPCVVTATSHGYSNGDEVYIASVGGMTELNGRSFKVAGKTTHTFQLHYLDGTNVNSTAFGTYTSGGTSKRVYQITTPFVEADLPEISYVQSADVITLAHRNYPPSELSRLSDTSWTLEDIAFGPTTSVPAQIAGISGGAGANTYLYVVTAVNKETREESAPGVIAGIGKTVSLVHATAPILVDTSTAHGFTTGDLITISGTTMPEINGNLYKVTVTGGSSFTLDGTNGLSYTAGVGGGCTRCNVRIASAMVPTAMSPHAITWNTLNFDAMGGTDYIVYKEVDGVYGFLGSAVGGIFNDIGLTPDTADTFPYPRNLFYGPGKYPSIVTYYQQRLMFASSEDEPETAWGSQSGRFKNFNKHSPAQDDDAVTFTMAGRQVNEVRHLIDLGKLLLMTSGGEHAVLGDSGGTLKPSAVNPRQISYNGSSSVPPIVIGANAIYVQARGSIVRDFLFDDIKGSEGSDLTIFAAHLFEGHTITSWAYQQNPHSVVWAVRDDGVLIGLTYVREQQIIAWHRHDLGGLVENVCVVPEGDEDAVYVVVNRTINGGTKRYLERISSRRIDDIVDYIGMDSTLSYDGRNTGSTTMTLSGGTTWSHLETLTLTASASTFLSTDVGNAIFLNTTNAEGEAERIRFTINAYTSATVVTGKASHEVPASLRSTATTDWARAVDQITGLWHLEGEQVSVFADGSVVSNPNNDSYDSLTVTGGTITMDKPYSVVHVGLPYICDLETLDIDTTQGETLADKQKSINKVNLHLNETRGVWVGGASPSDDDTDPLEGLTELKVRSDENYDDPIALASRVEPVVIESSWNSNGRIFIRQVDPLPVSVLAVSPAGYVPIKGQ